MSDDTGQAFPQQTWVNPANGEYDWGSPGLTKRELFAAMVLQGFLSRPIPYLDGGQIVEASVSYADTLIAELNSSEGHAP